MVKLPENLEFIIKEMFKRVGADYDSADLEDPDWFRKHTWTKEEQEQFSLWLKQYLKNNKEAREELMKVPTANKRHIDKFVNMFVFNYGWMLKEDDTNGEEEETRED